MCSLAFNGQEMVKSTLCFPWLSLGCSFIWFLIHVPQVRYLPGAPMNLRGYDVNHNPFCLHTSQLFCVSVSPISAAVMVRTRLTRLCRQKAAKSYPYRCLRVCFGFFQIRRVFSQNKTIRPIAVPAQVPVSKRTWMSGSTNGEKGKFFTALPAGRHGLP